MSVYDENLKSFPELNDLKKWIDAGNKNDFLESIFAQASKRVLSDKQINAAINSYYKIMNPPKRITFDEQEQIAYKTALNILANASPMGYEFYTSIMDQIGEKKSLSEKQWESVKKKFHRFRKTLMRKILG